MQPRRVSHPGEYPWSSYRGDGVGVKIGLLAPHAEYLAPGGKLRQLMIAVLSACPGVATESPGDFWNRCCNDAEPNGNRV